MRWSDLIAPLKQFLPSRRRRPAGESSGGPAIDRRTSLGVLAGSLATLPAASAARAAAAQPTGALPEATPQAGMSDAGIAHRRSPSAQITSVHGKLRHLVFAQEDYGFAPGGDARRNAAALQNAINEAQIIHLPDSGETATFADTIALLPYTRLVGSTAERTRLVSSGPLAFAFEAPDGPAREVSGPQLEDFSLYCVDNGLRINRESGGFSDTNGQQSVMRPLLRRIRLTGSHDAAARRARPDSVGVLWIKCFDGIIDQCEIKSFGTGYRSIGSDLVDIRGRTRLWSCDTLVDAQIRGSFGGSLHLDGLDLLMARKCYIRSADRHLIVTNCYLEHYPGTPPLEEHALQLSHGYAILFKSNRIELPFSSVPKFLKVDDRDGHLFVFEDNAAGGEPWGEVLWNAPAGTRYWASQYDRQKIIHRGNAGADPLPLPLRTAERIEGLNSRSGPWVFNPDNPGLEFGDYGLQTRVRDGAFILLTGSGASNRGGATTHGIHFHPDRGTIDGRVDVWVQAKAEQAGKVLQLWHVDGAQWRATARQPLTTGFAWYRMFQGIQAADLRLWAVNDDTNLPGAILLKEIVVEMPAGGAEL